MMGLYSDCTKFRAYGLIPRIFAYVLAPSAVEMTGLLAKSFWTSNDDDDDEVRFVTFELVDGSETVWAEVHKINLLTNWKQQ